MPYKDGGGGKPQPYDDGTGRYTQFQNFARPRAMKEELAKTERKKAYEELFGNDSNKLHRYKEWTINSNDDYKGYIYDDLAKNKDKTLKYWYNDYKLKSGDFDLSYEEFLNKPLKLYRATNIGEKENAKNPFFSYAQDRRTAERFLSGSLALDNGRTGEIEEITITPNQTFGMLASDENEIIIPNKAYEKNNQSILDRVNKLVDYANKSNVKLPYDSQKMRKLFYDRDEKGKAQLEETIKKYIENKRN